LYPSIVSLTGRLHLNDSLSKKPHQIEISYNAVWICGFFGLRDCRAPEFYVATVTPAPDETFSVELPNFSRTAQDAARTMAVSESNFRLWLLDATKTPIKELQPDLRKVSTADGSLKVLPGYPPDISFSPCESLH
jgi:hypothetical protein